MLHRLLGVALVALVLACGPAVPLPPNPPPVPADGDWCPAAEQRLLDLQCRDHYGRLIGGPNHDGEPFSAQCVAMQTEMLTQINPRCLAGMKACTETKQCMRAPAPAASGSPPGPTPAR
jgi:hypothetical protein